MPSKIEPVQSPCVGICNLDENNICLGCFRELQEIKAWALINNAQRTLILGYAEIRAIKYKDT